jgi:glycosyltransferase involved in cell wall biosynthesis
MIVVSEQQATASSVTRRVLVDARPLQGDDALRGIGSYVRGLISGLLEEGYDDRIALLLDADRPPPPVPAGSFLAFTVRRRYRGRVGLIEEASVLPDRLAELHPALYHATTLALPGRSPVPLVATVHDLIPWALDGRRLMGERTRWWLGKRLLRKADLVVVPSEATAQDVRRYAGVARDRLIVIPEAPAAGFCRAQGAAERVRRRHGLHRPYVLFVGALDVRKSPLALLRAWSIACAEGTEVELVLVGPASRQAPRDLGPARRLGYVDHAELVDLYSAASCLLFPSRYEGFGLPVLEAMACGCPVVAYRNSSLPEVAGTAALLVDDGDAVALGRAAARVLTEPGLAARMRAAGLAHARQFTWRRTARTTIGVYERLIGSSSVAR